MGGKEVDVWTKLRGDDMTAWYDKEMYDRQRCDSCRRQVQAVREKYYGTDGGEIVVSDKLVCRTCGLVLKDLMEGQDGEGKPDVS